jgi:hypothetical protein
MLVVPDLRVNDSRFLEQAAQRPEPDLYVGDDVQGSIAG